MSTESRTSNGIDKTDATGPFKLTLRPLHGRGRISFVRNPRFPLFGDLTREELLHLSALAREAADAIAVIEKARAA